MNRKASMIFFAGIMGITMALPAQATLTVNPTSSDWTLGDDFWGTTGGVFPDGGLRSGEDDLWQVVNDTERTLYDLLYKANVPEDSSSGGVIGEEEGNLFDGSYQTGFDGLDPEYASIGYTGGDSIGCDLANPCYLAIKDGNAADPAQYVFDISAWDGLMKLELSNFWVDEPGAISHVGIFGGGGSIDVPVPATLGLFGAGLLMLAGAGARRRTARKG